MKTKKKLVLYPAVFAIVSMLVSCNSVGFAQGASIIIEPQQIRISKDKDKDYWFCVDLSQDRQCPEIISISYDACKTKTPFKEGTDRAEFFDTVLQGRQVKNIVGLPCNSFITDVEGNTTYYCTPWKCYPR